MSWREWLHKRQDEDKILMANDSGQMAKKDNPLRCPALAPEKPELRCNWHVNKHPRHHMALSHEHNSKEATIWYWESESAPSKAHPFDPKLCNAHPVGQGVRTDLDCNLEKGHSGQHRGENDTTICQWG